MDGNTHANRQHFNSTNALYYISFSACLLLYLSTYMVNNNDTPERKQGTDGALQPPGSPADILPTDSGRRKKSPVFVDQPSTPSSYMFTHILPQMLEDYVLQQSGCVPEDVDKEEKHKIPVSESRTKKHEAKSAMVIYVAVALLLMSLGATVVDFCKAKSELKNDQASHSCRKKPALTRRCSLADLTVLRHTRKELLRKESFCSAPVAGHSSGELQTSGRNWRINRPPLRLD